LNCWLKQAARGQLVQPPDKLELFPIPDWVSSFASGQLFEISSNGHSTAETLYLAEKTYIWGVMKTCLYIKKMTDVVSLKQLYSLLHNAQANLRPKNQK